MALNRFSEKVVTRVPANFKHQLVKLARARDLEVADLVREALREYLNDRLPAQTDQQPVAVGQEGGK